MTTNKVSCSIRGIIGNSSSGKQNWRLEVLEIVRMTNVN